FLRKKRDYAEALVLLRRGHELGSKRPDWRYPSLEWIRQAEQAQARDAKLPAVVKGEARPTDAAEGLALGGMCIERELYAAGARLCAEAFEADPKLAEDLEASTRYRAARAAALAGCGQGKDDLPADESARGRLRRQALEWLE